MNRNEAKRQLRSLAGTGKKVQLTRGLPGDPKHHGFVLACGGEWVLLRQFSDFHPDGLTALRVRDITEIRSGEYERHWERMLAAEGLLAPIEPPGEVDLDDVSRLLRGLQRRGRNVIVECEDAHDDLEDFYIGEIFSVDGESLHFANFDAMGRWDAAPKVIPLGEITQIQIDTPYADTFSKYLEGPYGGNRGGRGRSR